MECHEKQHSRKDTLWGSIKYVHNRTLQGWTLAETQLTRKPPLQAGASSNFSPGFLSKNLLHGFCYTSRLPVRVSQAKGLTLANITVLHAYVHPLPPLFGKNKHRSEQHWDNGHCPQSWYTANTCSQVNHWEMITFLAPKGFRSKGGTSQPRKLLVYQGPSLVLAERFLSKQSSNQPA